MTTVLLTCATLTACFKSSASRDSTAEDIVSSLGGEAKIREKLASDPDAQTQTFNIGGESAELKFSKPQPLPGARSSDAPSKKRKRKQKAKPPASYLDWLSSLPRKAAESPYMAAAGGLATLATVYVGGQVARVW